MFGNCCSITISSGCSSLHFVTLVFLALSNPFFCLHLRPCFGFQAIEYEVESRKHDLLRAIQDTKRGLETTADQRSSIEEALVCFLSFAFAFMESYRLLHRVFLFIEIERTGRFRLVLNCSRKWQVIVEGYNRGAPIELEKLDGTWRLQYTSASDVLILLEAAARLPFFQV